jgi:LmbE family N-acetylglucosaminyl deacetylase
MTPTRTRTAAPSPVATATASHVLDYDQWFERPWGHYAFGVESAAVVRAAPAVPNGLVLDAGCGTGRFSTLFADQHATSVGVDIDPDMLRIAEPRLAGRGFRASVDNRPFPNDTFDLTMAVTILEFVTHPAAALAELARVTHPGGRIVVGALNPRSPWGLANRRRLRSGVWCDASFLSRPIPLRPRHAARPRHPACRAVRARRHPGAERARPRPRDHRPSRPEMGRFSGPQHHQGCRGVTDENPHASSALFVCAHPDDESFGLGAVLSNLADAGSRLSVLCFTHGEASTLHGVDGDLGTIRAAELHAAGAILGVTHLELLDYRDGRLDAQPIDELATHVRRIAHDVDATTLLVFDEGGITGHPDHQRATESARCAARHFRLPVLAWALPRNVASTLNNEFSTTFTGRGADELDLSIPVDRTRQLAAIACHRSQSTDNPVLWRRLDLLGPTEHLRYLT